MYIKLLNRFISPLERTKEQQTPAKDKIEFKLTRLGWVLYSNNYAIYETTSLSKITQMMVKLRELGIYEGQVGW